MRTTSQACLGQGLEDEGMRKKRMSNNRSSKIKPLWKCGDPRSPH
jgi:hypothetical protein